TQRLLVNITGLVLHAQTFSEGASAMSFAELLHCFVRLILLDSYFLRLMLKIYFTTILDLPIYTSELFDIIQCSLCALAFHFTNTM
uniref:Uncharacterized protein n=1 Tax=Coturnix japonica TaxID=93934 RepID=A0A8C2SPE5_COTJA